MNVCFVMQDTGRVYGAERATLDLVQGLRHDNIGVHVLLVEEQRLNMSSSALRTACESIADSCIAIPVRHAFSLSLVQDLRKAFSRANAEIVHSVGYKADIHALLATSRGARVPHVATVHGWLRQPDLKERFYGMLDLWALRRTSAVIALSSYYCDYLSARGVERLEHIPSGVNMDGTMISQHASGVDGRPFTVGMLGRLSHEKNHKMFVDVALAVHEEASDVRFLVAGDGPLREALIKYAGDKKLSNVMQFAGYMDRIEFFQQIDAICSCSRIENLPYGLMEAMSLGKPVLATDVGGVGDLVVDGVTGCLVSSGDMVTMARHIIELSRDPAQCTRLAEAGRQRMDVEFSVRACVDRHKEVYHGLINA